MECYLNCGCYPRRCRLGLPPASFVRPVEAEAQENLRFDLRGWSPVSVSTSAIGPLVVLAEAFEVPIVLLPPSLPLGRQFSTLDKYIVMTYTDWVRSGYPNFARDIEYPNMKPLGTAGLKKLGLADSWFTSADPEVMYGACIRERGLGRRDPSRETIELWLGIGLRGFGLQERSPTPLSWWKMYYRRLRSRNRASIASRLWGLPLAWISFGRFLEKRRGILRSPWTVTQQRLLVISAPDTHFLPEEDYDR